MFRDRAVLLRAFPLGETSRIVSVLTAQHGRLRLVARGVRTRHSPLGSCLQSGNLVEIVFTQRPDRDLGHVREAALQDASLASLQRLDAMSVGLAALELLDRLLPLGASDPQLFDQTQYLLGKLGGIEQRAAAVECFYAFEFVLLERWGVSPRVSHCRVCEEAIHSQAYLDWDSANCLCAGCEAAGERKLGLSARVLSALDTATRRPWDLECVSWPPSDRRQLGLVLHRLLLAHVERYRYPQAMRLLRVLPKLVDQSHRLDAVEPEARLLS